MKIRIKVDGYWLPLMKLGLLLLFLCLYIPLHCEMRRERLEWHKRIAESTERLRRMTIVNDRAEALYRSGDYAGVREYFARMQTNNWTVNTNGL